MVDPVLVRLARVEDPWLRTVTADDVNLPRMRAFQRAEAARLFSAAARKLDLGAPAPQR